DTVQGRGAMGKELLQHLVDSFSALETLQIGAVSDMAEHTDRVAGGLRLNNQFQAVRQGCNFRVDIRSRDGELIQLLCPRGKRGCYGLGRRKRLRFAEGSR